MCALDSWSQIGGMNNNRVKKKKKKQKSVSFGECVLCVYVMAQVWDYSARILWTTSSNVCA